MSGRLLRMLGVVTLGAGAAYVARRVVDDRRDESRLSRPVRDWPTVPLGAATVPTSAADGPPAPGGSWAEPVDRSCPEGYPVKAKLRSRLYHLPGMAAYERTGPDRCYATPEGAEADGFTRASR